MTDPGALAARVQAAQQGLQQLMAATQREGREAGEVRAGLGDLAGRATSKDGGITVTVDSSGAVTGLELTSAIGRFGPQQLATEILTCLRRAQTDLAGNAKDRFGGSAFGERIAASYAQRYPEPPEPEEPVPGKEMSLGRLHEDSGAAARRPEPVRVARPDRQPDAVEDEGFGGTVFNRGDR